ncbi:MAG: 3-deoxy-manno-octulosonate cytidylyltransferase [Pseudomonadota bacterium]
MSFTVIIPARHASTRLPGKPLLDIGGWPMIRHVHDRAIRSGAAAVYVATDDQRIADAVGQFTDNVVLTSPDHQSGTDRVEEVARRVGLSDEEIVVNVQGDEPLIDPRLIGQVAGDLSVHPDAGISSLYESLTEGDAPEDANLVKVVTDERGFALYFSRSMIPWQRASEASAMNLKRHIGIYAYRVATLRRFVTWPPADLERMERLEQLRALVNGVRIHMSEACVPSSGGVDTETDLQRVRTLLAGH